MFHWRGWLIYLFDKYLLRVCYRPGLFPASRDIALNQTRTINCREEQWTRNSINKRGDFRLLYKIVAGWITWGRNRLEEMCFRLDIWAETWKRRVDKPREEYCQGAEEWKLKVGCPRFTASKWQKHDLKSSLCCSNPRSSEAAFWHHTCFLPVSQGNQSLGQGFPEHGRGEKKQTDFILSVA